MPNSRSQFQTTAYNQGQNFFLGLVTAPDFTTPGAVKEFNAGHDTECADANDIFEAFHTKQ